MDNAGSNAILTPEELDAALAEVGTVSGGSLPSLDDGSAPMMIEVPVEQPAISDKKSAKESKTTAGAAGKEKASSAKGATLAEPTAKPGAKSNAKPAAPPAAKPSEPPAATPAAVPQKPAPGSTVAAPELAAASGGPHPAAPRRTLGQWVYHLLDVALDVVNRPFGWVRETWRPLVGAVALTTIVICAAAAAIAPWFHPQRDPFWFRDARPASAETVATAEPPADTEP